MGDSMTENRETCGCEPCWSTDGQRLDAEQCLYPAVKTKCGMLAEMVERLEGMILHHYTMFGVCVHCSAPLRDGAGHTPDCCVREIQERR